MQPSRDSEHKDRILPSGVHHDQPSFEKEAYNVLNDRSLYWFPECARLNSRNAGLSCAVDVGVEASVPSKTGLRSLVHTRGRR